jgi:hypothetical protein
MRDAQGFFGHCDYPVYRDNHYDRGCQMAKVQGGVEASALRVIACCIYMPLLVLHQHVYKQGCRPGEKAGAPTVVKDPDRYLPPTP